MTDKFQSFITVFMLVDTIFAEMKNIRTLTKRRAVSPVIATVILVAVTITVAVAVSYWMAGISGQYTQFEKVEIQSGYAVKTYTDPLDPLLHTGWSILITLKNSGTTTSTLINCFINEQLIDLTGTDLVGVTAVGLLLPARTSVGIISSTDTGITIESGDSVEVTITEIPLVFSSSGTTMNVKLHSAAGMDYIRLTQLP